MIRSFKEHTFFKDTFVLTLGTALSAVLGYLLAPVITRLYNPAEFADLGLFNQIVTIGALLITLRLDVALPVEKKEYRARFLYSTIDRMVFYTSLFFFVVSVILYAFLPAQIDFWWLFLPVGMMGLAKLNLGTNWAIRQAKFAAISYSKVWNSAVSNIGKVAMGVFGVGSIGFIIPTALGYWISSIFLAYRNGLKSDFPKITKIRHSIALIRSHREFAVFNLPHALVDVAKDLIVLLLFWSYFSKSEYGAYLFAFQMLRLPLNLFSASYGQVLFGRLGERVQKKEPIFHLAFQNLKVLVGLAIFPFLLIALFGEPIFDFVFSSKWHQAGTFAEIMAFWLMVNFIASPFSYLPLLIKKQKAFFLLSLAGHLLSLAVIVLAIGIKCTFEQTLMYYSIFQIIQLISILFVNFIYIKKHEN